MHRMFGSKKLYDSQYDRYRLTTFIRRCDTCPKDDDQRLRIDRLLSMKTSSCLRCRFIASAVETVLGRAMNVQDQIYAKFSDTRLYISHDLANHYQICEPPEHKEHKTEWRTSGFFDLPLETGGQDAVQWTKSRLLECLLEHSSCSEEPSEHAKPKRVLDLQQLEDRGLVMLVEGPEAENVDQYVCVSYCWGGEQKMCLTSATHQSLLRGLPLNELSLNFQQLLPFVRRLGFRFIWIDALCIQQDSLIDKRMEISMMRSIYEGAAITVALAASPGVDKGIFGKISTYAQSIPVKCADNESPFAGLLIRMEQSSTHLMQESGHIGGKPGYPLTRRAWAFQELNLSRRVLYITANEVMWKCVCKYLCQCGTAYVSDTAEKESFIFLTRWMHDYFTLRQLWDQFLSTYCSCALTIASDRFDALRGVAEKFAPQFGFYALGTWSSHLHESILWTKRNLDVDLRREDLYWPSWSWCSRCSAAGQIISSYPSELRKDPAVWRAPGLAIDNIPEDLLKSQPYFEEWAWLPSSRYLVLNLETIIVPIKITMEVELTRKPTLVVGESADVKYSRRKHEVIRLLSETGTEFLHSTLDHPEDVSVWVPYRSDFATLYRSRFEQDYNIAHDWQDGQEFSLAPIIIHEEYHKLAGPGWYTYDMQCLVLRKLGAVFERIGTYSVRLSNENDVDVKGYPLSFFSATSGARLTTITIV